MQHGDDGNYTMTNTNRRRVAITGLGAITPLATDVPKFWAALCAGRSGIGPITQFDASRFRVHFGGEVKDFDAAKILGVREARRLDRFAQYGLAAAIEAVADSGLDLPQEDLRRCGVALGSSVGGLTEFEEQHDRYRANGPGRLSPFMIPRFMPNAASGAISIHFGLRGPNVTISTACASANQAIEHALRLLRLNQVDVILGRRGRSGADADGGSGGFCARPFALHAQ